MGIIAQDSRPVTSGPMVLLLLACVLDRTGQSASEAMRREIAVQGVRLSNVEASLQDAERRVAQLEELQRDRGQEEIQKMETVDELRSETARLRGDVETLLHDSTSSGQSVSKMLEDAEFRVTWLEARAAQLEKSLGLKPPAPPRARARRGCGIRIGSGTGIGAEIAAASADAAVTDPDAMMKLARSTSRAAMRRPRPPCSSASSRTTRRARASRRRSTATPRLPSTRRTTRRRCCGSRT
jgi:hypothetical protein